MQTETQIYVKFQTAMDRGQLLLTVLSRASYHSKRARVLTLLDGFNETGGFWRDQSTKHTRIADKCRSVALALQPRI